MLRTNRQLRSSGNCFLGELTAGNTDDEGLLEVLQLGGERELVGDAGGFVS